MHLGTRPDADALAEPHRGRQLRVRRQASSAPAHRARKAECDPRARSLVHVDCRRPQPRPRRDGVHAPAPAGLPVHGRAQHRVRTVGPRACGSRNRDEHRIGAVSVRSWGASVSQAGRADRRLAYAARPGPHRLRVRRAKPPHRDDLGGRDRVRLPLASSCGHDEARYLLHGPRTRRRRSSADDVARSFGPEPRSVGRRGLRLRDGLHRRPAAGRRTSQPCRRAGDLPAERLSHRRVRDHARAGSRLHRGLGDRVHRSSRRPGSTWRVASSRPPRSTTSCSCR